MKGLLLVAPSSTLRCCLSCYRKSAFPNSPIFNNTNSKYFNNHSPHSSFPSHQLLVKLGNNPPFSSLPKLSSSNYPIQRRSVVTMASASASATDSPTQVLSLPSHNSKFFFFFLILLDCFVYSVGCQSN